MKKKILIAVVFFAAIGFGVYRYMYKEHRDIASENADFTMTVKELQNQFTTDNVAAGKKYADKTVEISGKITSVDAESHSVVIDEKLSAVFKDSLLQNVSVDKPVKIKGRFVGYDDLLEEFKMDQVTVSE